MTKDNVRYRVITATKEVIAKSDGKFTMDDIAKKAGISKKTIYNNFEDKNEVLFCVVEHIFDNIREHRIRIVNDSEMDIVEKIKKLITLIPMQIDNPNICNYAMLYPKCPEIINYIRDKINVEWNCVEEYLSIAMKQGRIKRANLSAIKVVGMGAIDYYLKNKEMCQDNDVAINEIVSIIINGLRMK